jgi:uncharacterized SAM-binding protein YcdF (DUF218 family)
MRRWLLLAAVIAAVAAVWGYAGRATLLQAIGDFLVVNDPLTPADAVITISGNGPERVTTSVDLLREGYGRWLLVSGGPYALGPRRTRRNSAWVMRDQAIAAGVPSQQILMDDRAGSTYENAAGAARLMREHGLHTAIVVTSPYHARRAGVVFSRVFRAEGLAVRVRSAGDSFFGVHQWWTRRRDRDLVLREYIKLLAAWGGAR